MQAMSWLLLSALIQVYSEKEEKVGQKVIKNVHLVRKTGSEFEVINKTGSKLAICT